MAVDLAAPSYADAPILPFAAGVRDRVVASGVLAFATLVAAALLGSRIGYVPMWDGFIYADAINAGATWPPSPESLRLAGHASHAYALLAIAAQFLSPGSFWPLLLLNAALFAAACVGFHRLLRIAFPNPAYEVDTALLTAALAVQPSILATVVQPGIDLPVVPGFIWCTVLMLERRWVATVIVGLVLAFSKETGVLLYAVLLATYGVWTLLRTPGDARARFARVVRLLPLATPVIVFALYLVWRKYSAPVGEPVVWNAGTAMINQSLLRQLLLPRIDRYVASFVAMMVVLNFSWVATAFTAGGGVVYLRRVMRPGKWQAMWQVVVETAGSVVGFLALLAAASAFALTRFATYANTRYVVPMIPLLFVLFLASLVVLVRRRGLRRGILTVFATLLVVSTVATVDPVSRALYGTFAVGERELLRMTSITRECCGAGRDQLVYNLEFTTLEALMSDALASAAPTNSTLIVVPDSTHWYVAERLDPVTRRRTVRREGAIVPRVVESDAVDSLVAAIGPAVTARPAYYLALPNANVERGLATLGVRYVVGAERRHRRGGYALSLYTLTPRGEAAPGGAK